jgi:hypothetical protein
MSAAVFTVAFTITAGCSDGGDRFWTGAGTDTKSPSSGVPGVGEHGAGADLEKRRATFDRLRGLDPCALLDPAIAKQVAGASQTSPAVPGSYLSQCGLDTDSWGFVATIGMDLAKPGWRKAEKKTVAGAEWLALRVEDTCSYATPIEEEVGMMLTITAPLDQPPSGTTACEVAEDYVTRAASLLETRPSRAESTQQPRLPLADVDPCAPVEDVLDAVDRGKGAAVPKDIYVCAIQPEDGTASDLAEADISMAFRFEEDPRQPGAKPQTGPPSKEPIAVEPGAIVPIRLGQHSGVAFAVDGGLCSAALVIDDAVNQQVGSLRYVQTVTAYSTDCGVAQVAAAATVESIGAP